MVTYTHILSPTGSQEANAQADALYTTFHQVLNQEGGSMDVVHSWSVGPVSILVTLPDGIDPTTVMPGYTFEQK